MHSGRMRTARLLTVLGEGGGLPNLGGGGLHPWGSASTGVCIWGLVLPNPGGLHRGGLPNPGGSASCMGSVQPQGGLHPGGVFPTVRGLHPGVIGQTPSPPVNRMIHRCKNITLPQTSFPGGNKCSHAMPVSNSTNAFTHVQVCGSNSLAVMLATKRSAEENLRNPLHAADEVDK